MTDDIIVLYGKTRQYRQDNSVVLLTDLIDDYVTYSDTKSVVSERAIGTIQNVIKWLDYNDITQDDVTISMYSYKMVHTYSTSVRYFIIFDKTEHRTLFILSKDNLLDTEETPQ